MKEKLLGTLAIGALMVGMASPAHSTLQIAATVGTSSFSCVDNASCDLNPATGTLTLAPTNIGGVIFEGSSQFQTIGPPTNALLTNSQQITNNTGTTQTITFVVGGTDFASPTTTATAAGSGTWLNAPNSTITMQWYGDTANNQGASNVTDLPGTLLATGGPFTATGGADSFDTGQIPLPWVTTSPYSWTMWAQGDLVSGGTATLAGRSQDITSDVTAVSEPGSLAILGSGLMFMGWFMHRRRNKKQEDFGQQDLLAA